MNVIVDGSTDVVRTHRQNASSLFLDLGLNLSVHDHVSVKPDHPLVHGMTVEISRAPFYRLLIDNLDLTVASWGRSPAEVIADAGFAIDHHDQVVVNGREMALSTEHALPHVNKIGRTYAFNHPWQAYVQEPLQMRVYRAIPITVNDNGLTLDIRTTAQTVGEALRAAKITIFLGDTVIPSLGTSINTGLRIYIKRSIPLSINVDGRYIKTRTQSETVADALAEMGIMLAGLDKIEPAMDTQLYDNIEIAVSRISEDIEVEEDIVPFETVFVPDQNLLIDTQQLINPGAEGITRRRSRVRYEDGDEISRELEDTWVAQEPAQRVIAYGQNVVPNTAVVDGQEITYWRRVRMLATSYSAGTAGVSPDAPWYGTTYSGDVMRKGIVAVDPVVVPLRTRVFVPNYGYGDALDTGSAILARRIDLGYDDHNLILWNQWTDVYLLWPPPPEYQITWVLPNWPPRPR